MKHVSNISDRSSPRVETGVQVKSTKSYKLALMEAATIGARRISNAQLSNYESTGVVLKESTTNDKSAPILPDMEELKKTPIKKSVRKEMFQELRKRSMSQVIIIFNTLIQSNLFISFGKTS